jgi:hypothetical protein
MEHMLAVLIGAGAVLLMPLVPGLRPLVKTVVKGGLVAAETTKVAAAVVGQTWRDVVHQASDEVATDTVAEAASNVQAAAADVGAGAETSPEK